MGKAIFTADLCCSSKYSNEKKTLKTEVEKGFLRTAFDQELIDPKLEINLWK